MIHITPPCWPLYLEGNDVVIVDPGLCRGHGRSDLEQARAVQHPPLQLHWVQRVHADLWGWQQLSWAGIPRVICIIAILVPLPRVIRRPLD